MTTRMGRLSLVLLLALVAGVPRAAEAKQATVAVVVDGPSEQNGIVERIEPELKRLLGSGYRVTFKTSPDFDARWRPARYRQAVVNAMNDRSVDVVLGVGVLVARAAANPDLPLEKPFVSATVLNGEVPGLPYSEKDRSLKKNLSLVLIPCRMDADIRGFHEMIPFRRMLVGIQSEAYYHLEDIGPALKAYSDELGIELVPFPMTGSLEEILSRLGPAEEAFYLTAAPRQTREARRDLIRALNDRKIPTFSDVGPSDVELGALATLKPDITVQAVRRVALNLDKLIRGVPSDKLPVFLLVDRKLLINAESAVRIGYVPSFEVRLSASFLHEEAFEESAEALDPRKVMELAEAGNTFLTVSDAQLETSLRDKQVSRSPMLPQIYGGASYTHSDREQISNFLPSNQAAAGVALSQMIFDDRRISDFRSSDRAWQAAKFRRETDRYDVISQAEEAYHLYVLARVLYRIQRSNLRLTEGNLETARMRADAGISGKDEIYRWQAQADEQRALLLASATEVTNRRIALNQVLGLDQLTPWRPEEVRADPGSLLFLGGRLDFELKTPPELRALEKASVKIAKENAPEILFLDKSIEAQEIQVGQLKRSFFLPSINANLSYDRNFWQSPDAAPGKTTLDLDGHTLLADVTATLPILEGTRRIYDLKRQQSILNELTRRRTMARELVARRTNTATERLASSYPNIRISRSAADNAKENLEIVREKYAQGIVGITDLLDAQNTSFSAEQKAQASVYNYLIDLVAYQRAISFFEYDKTPQELDGFADRLREAIGAQP